MLIDCSHAAQQFGTRDSIHRTNFLENGVATMKTRCVFSTPDLQAAQAAMHAARVTGIDDKDLSLIARDDIELNQIADHRLIDHNDSNPAAARGIGLGGGTGLLLGLIAVAVPPLGLTLAGVGAMTVAGAAMGAWTGALVGFNVPDAVSRAFEEQIKAGNILVIIDGEAEQLPAARIAVEATGATPLPFEEPTAMT